jgi:hypothetical protein
MNDVTCIFSREFSKLKIHSLSQVASYCDGGIPMIAGTFEETDEFIVERDSRLYYQYFFYIASD